MANPSGQFGELGPTTNAVAAEQSFLAGIKNMLALELTHSQGETERLAGIIARACGPYLEANEKTPSSSPSIGLLDQIKETVERLSALSLKKSDLLKRLEAIM